MPIYVYEILDHVPSDEGLEVFAKPEEGEGLPPVTFEITQRISDPPLTVHPETGQPVRRIIQAPFIGGSWSDSAMHKSSNDDKKLDRLGFTKYVKAGDGFYEKRAGKGPDVISKDRPILPSDLK
ncbi:MAG: zinc ribbon domain-containing protein [Planctomycetaceae bacterium]